MHGRSTSTAGHLVEDDDGEAWQLGESLGERESQTEQLQNCTSELTVSLSQAQDQPEALQHRLDEMVQQKDEAEASLRGQVAKCEARISRLTESLTEHEAVLHGQIAQLQEKISQMEVSLTASDHEESRSQAESALAQIQQQRDLLKKSPSERSQASLELRDLVNELFEVTDWFHFGVQLNLPFSQLMVIKRNTVQNNVLGKIYMLQEWLNTVGSEASWADVVAALARMGMQGSAQRLAEKHDVPMSLAQDTPTIKAGSYVYVDGTWVPMQLNNGTQYTEESFESMKSDIAKILELMEHLVLMEEELQQRKESEAALRSNNAQLQEMSQREAKISEPTETQALVETEREESEAAFRSDIALLQQGMTVTDNVTITELSGQEFQRVSATFTSTWATGKDPCPTLSCIFEVKNTMLSQRWTAYQKTLSQKGMEEHCHGTKLTCNITATQTLCTDQDCGICGICSDGLDRRCIRKNIDFQRFGHGFYLAPNSSKCHDYTQGAHGYRAMLLCEVLPGTKYHLTQGDPNLKGPPPGHDSVYGKSGADLNYDEIVVYNPDCVMPRYVCVYQKGGTNKIAS